MIRTAKKRKIKKGKEHGGSPYRPKEWKTCSTLRHWPKRPGWTHLGMKLQARGTKGATHHGTAGPAPRGPPRGPVPEGHGGSTRGKAELGWKRSEEPRALPGLRRRVPRGRAALREGRLCPTAEARTGKAAVVCSQMAAEPPLQGRADQPHKGPSTHPKRSHSTDRSFWSARMWLKEFDSHNTHISYYFTLNIFFQTTYFESLAKPNPAVPTQLPPCLAELLKSGLTDKVEHHWRFQSPGPPQWPLLYSVRMP